MEPDVSNEHGKLSFGKQFMGREAKRLAVNGGTFKTGADYVLTNDDALAFNGDKRHEVHCYGDNLLLFRSDTQKQVRVG